MGQVLLSTTILASFLGGMVALAAPCCVSVMLPAFFASSFQRRSRILAMTFVFAAGVGTVILPIALGAAVVSRVLFGYHLWIFSAVGLAMIALGAATLGGWKMMLPMPSGRGGGKGIGSVYGLGVFSGAASACCAPVLAGVAALSGAASSFPAALAVGVAYVFGMVAPLCVLALVWDKKNWGASRWLTSRTVPLWPGASRRVPLMRLLSSALMIAMGVLTVVIAVQEPGMAPDGWQVEVTAALNHAAAGIQQFLAFVPGWISGPAVFAVLALLLWAARRYSKPGPRDPQSIRAGSGTAPLESGPAPLPAPENTSTTANSADTANIGSSSPRHDESSAGASHAPTKEFH
ncbi:cytochrome c biogenesis protein CcdA [Paenarthrobacter sp. Z7-10]|uniref:cytochrome c biogenesis CcdA family protein n=1 Tax=Paenarthrobacter sp. Z7-10 TaxID=2787635 RepID=UPI0022A951EC|nr:cytochrome c biogenesis protein CcdA [Paenarthrobacter sp. Z7-10]MCZ2404444.1 cytochrome c biogenesis protein CcdA [Paenarthrobacter sp. Z7-10]